jgi:hypothetical protein
VGQSLRPCRRPEGMWTFCAAAAALDKTITVVALEAPQTSADLQFMMLEELCALRAEVTVSLQLNPF